MTVLTLADAKAHLNLSGLSSTLSDVEIQSFINSAVDVVSKRVGPLEPTNKTDRVWSNGWSLTVRTTPVISLTSVTAVYVSTTADVSSLFVSPSGVVTWSNTWNWFYAGWYDVAYVAGYQTVPPGLLTAVKEVVWQMATTQRGHSARPTAGQIESGPGNLFTPAAREAMEPYEQEFGFA